MNSQLKLESTLIGELIIDPDAIHDLTVQLTEEMFTIDTYRTIFRTIRTLHEQGTPIDLLTIYHQLNRSGSAIDVVELSAITREIAGTSHVNVHACLLHQNYIREQLRRLGDRLIHADSDPADIMAEAEDTLYSLTDSAIVSEPTLIASDIDAVNQRVAEVAAGGQAMLGLPSGFTALDRKTLGFHPTDLIILAARPSQGKTALAVSMARQMALAGTAVGFFSLEMGRAQLSERLLMQQSGIAGEKVRSGVMNTAEQQLLNEAAGQLRTLPIYLDDTPALSITLLRQKAKKLVRRQGVRIIIVDYLQLMTASVGKNATRENEVAKISRALKCIAKELNIPILALSQLNREPDRGAEVREPRLSDLRESGAIEQDADLVIMLHKPTASPPAPQHRMLIIAKHRNGATGDVLLSFDATTARFDNPNLHKRDCPPCVKNATNQEYELQF